MDKIKIRIPRKKLEDFCRRNHIRKLTFFGSVLSDDFGPDSDIDVLVEFELGNTPGLAFFSMSEDLEQIFGRKVDLMTFKGVKSSRNPVRVGRAPGNHLIYGYLDNVPFEKISDPSTGSGQVFGVLDGCMPVQHPKFRTSLENCSKCDIVSKCLHLSI